MTVKNFFTGILDGSLSSDFLGDPIKPLFMKGISLVATGWNTFIFFLSNPEKNLLNSTGIISTHSQVNLFAKEHKNTPTALRSPNLNTVAVPREYGMPSEFLACMGVKSIKLAI